MNTIKAIQKLVPNAVFDIEGEDYDKIKWYESNKEKLPSKSEVDAEIVRLEQEFKDTQYQRDRLSEYPSIQELVVALYDADDKAEIDKKRAEIKKKYPKPE